MKEKKFSFSSIGFASIVLIFVSMAILTFTVLSYMTALSDYRLSKKVAEKNSDYCIASSKGEIYLQYIDDRLLSLYQHSDDRVSFFSGINDAFADLEDVSVYREVDDYYISYGFPMNENQSLDICLKINYPKSHYETFYKIVRWKTIVHPEENSEYIDDDLPVFLGD